ncbi:MAG: YtxH domain-containing protein [Muribaculaceae bacterium]|nr:YtxH domain-containing protein [Muribaculaceae bacterium]MDE6627928.1 YtxH domain-containing protein [Muribaculaceae bacterium]
MKNLDIILSVIGGALVGASLGLLFAPRKGEDTRDEILGYLESKGVNIKKLKRSKLDKLVSELKDEIA